jgi:DNA helicase HerA-like ATPase
VSGLRLANDLILPPEAVTQTFAILAIRGSGKTYTAAVMVEEMVKAGLPVAVVDPIGVWWGLRADTAGTGPGLPVVVFGGDHGDLVLEANAGEAVADAIVDLRPPAVIDLSLFSIKEGGTAALRDGVRETALSPEPRAAASGPGRSGRVGAAAASERD